MPEGPEVRKYADALHSVLAGSVITAFQARTRNARAWLECNEQRVIGQRVERVLSHGKHLLGYLENRFYFHSHLMMWGRWRTFVPNAKAMDVRVVPKGSHKRERDEQPPRQKDVPAPPVETDAFRRGKFVLEKDRRERARIIVKGGAAVLLSAPIFNVGEGDPYEQIEILATLGPDALPYNRRFNATEFRRRLLLPQHLELAVGAALLNQQIVAGLGNYLRAEILFGCRLNPWRLVGDLTERELQSLTRAIPRLTRLAYERAATASEAARKRMASDPALVYQSGREYGTRHMVFRRTNLPCLRCGASIKQLRQKTWRPEPLEEEGERTRIVYFCPECQTVRIDKGNRAGDLRF